ncbi:uncharacterized protein PADG_12297 [Paracoccidioides brasiliensis Pb18]|uniref:Uncharacterized protein n=1 Tax=Paracoccidioides brasiliensis (strain Pb18) TaxID=502780 RepID=A0A0A0HTG9_PARBD|nr:uncharacterized protein PADG_12297 [Paracoccidioides brasiliensis Pb18]KGM91613.1 hypothetical protein PADG_12297 [Paracoccidioides brasiliensis Pb18]
MLRNPGAFDRGSLVATGPQKSIQWPLPSTAQHGHKLALFGPTRSMDRVPWTHQAYCLLPPAWQPRSVALGDYASDHMM